MTQQDGQFPNETYIAGLRDNPDSTLAVVYDEFRQPVIRSLTAMGGSEAEGAFFFQTAVIDAARFARSGILPANLPFLLFLKTLGKAHYKDWLEANNAEMPGPGEPPEPGSHLVDAQIPDRATLLETRRRIQVWAQLENLDADCREALLLLPEGPDAVLTAVETGALDETCREQFQKIVREPDAPAAGIPDWALAALQDRNGYAVWQRTQELEKEWAVDKPAAPESNRVWRWAMALLLLVAVGYSVYQFYYHPKTAAEVFADNFAPPASLLEDFGARYGPEMGNDSVSARPNQCIQLLQEADAYYRAKEYKAAMDPLLLIVLDSNSICQSDAWYFLGIVQLQLEDPTTAIQCFAKIEDLQRYGEDLYWYQALAFVQLAKENPLMRDKARRAVERSLGNTRNPKRRAQAESMLKNLSK